MGKKDRNKENKFNMKNNIDKKKSLFRLNLKEYMPWICSVGKMRICSGNVQSYSGNVRKCGGIVLCRDATAMCGDAAEMCGDAVAM
jgi:hypothetical protein